MARRQPLTRAEMLRALERLSEVLSEKGLKADMTVVGGAALVLAFDARPATRDIDAVFRPKNEVFKAAAQVARELALPDGWLNNDVKRFFGRHDRRASQALDLPGLRVMVAAPEYLLAMKILADRHDRDRDDVRFLIRHLRLTTIEEIERVFAEVYPYDSLSEPTRLHLEDMLASG
jgi:hypothetical protein